ncbi:MAG: hypothetical protein ACRDDF_05820, partial [Aeromonas sp.]
MFNFFSKQELNEYKIENIHTKVYEIKLTRDGNEMILNKNMTLILACSDSLNVLCKNEPNLIKKILNLKLKKKSAKKSNKITISLYSLIHLCFFSDKFFENIMKCTTEFELSFKEKYNEGIHDINFKRNNCLLQENAKHCRYCKDLHEKLNVQF